MIPSDAIAILQWWLIIFVIGVCFLPLTVAIFPRFFDKGYIFSKLLGIGIASYAVFLFGIIHLISFSQVNGFLVFLLTAFFINYFVFDKGKILILLKQKWRIFILQEIFFLAAIFAWSYVHSFNPDIHGLEKYMDYGFINSILRADYFPPKDMWFTPESINYYYFGHLVTAFLTKLSGVPSYLTFNIMLSTIFAFCLTGTFSIGANLFYTAQKNLIKAKFRIKLIAAGLLTAVLTTLGGNLHILYSLFLPYKVDEPKPLWELVFTPLTFPNSYWYPNATRFIYHTIHEFPIYSWVVADLHGHVLDIPFVLLIVAILFSLFINLDPENKNESQQGVKKSWFNSTKFKNFTATFVLHPLHIVLLGFLLAIMYMTNAWDGAIYLLLVALVIFYLIWERFTGNAKEIFGAKKRIASLFNFLASFGIRLIIPVILILCAFYVFTFPYNHFFKPFASGIGILCAPKFLSERETQRIIDRKTITVDHKIGPFSFKTVGFTGTTVTEKGKIGPFLFEENHCQHTYWWELLMLYGFFYFFVFSFLIYLTKAKKILRIDMFVLLLIILSTLLIFLPEFIYVKDIYPDHYRANTMFKLVFQAFIMLSLVSVYVISRISQTKVRVIFLIFSFILIGCVMTYPYLAVGSYYGNLDNYKGLDGLKYLKDQYPTDFNGISWLNNNVKGQPVILEAQGDSYTDYARVSANTGLPTILGWTVHEWLWRGDYSVPAPRIAEVTNIYETKDVNVARQLMDDYKVKYVFIGKLEYDKYPNLDEEKFRSLGKLVFQEDKTKIYEILR